MKWLFARVPLAIVNKAHSARQMYPYAISLIENVNTYVRTCERVSEKKTCQLLVAGMKKDIQALILEMSNLVWDSYKLESSVQKFADCIYNYREKVDELITVETTIDTHLKELENMHLCRHEVQRCSVRNPEIYRLSKLEILLESASMGLETGRNLHCLI